MCVSISSARMTTMIVGAAKNAGAPAAPTPDFQTDWIASTAADRETCAADGGCSADGAAIDEWTTLDDTAGVFSVNTTDNTLEYQTIDGLNDSELEINFTNQTEGTIKFDIKISNVTNVTSANWYDQIVPLHLRDDGEGFFMNIVIQVSEGGTTATLFELDGAGFDLGKQTLPDVSDWVEIIVYFKIDTDTEASPNGIAYISFGGNVYSVTTVDNDTITGIGDVWFGSGTSGWGDGTEDPLISYRNFRIWWSDQR